MQLSDSLRRFLDGIGRPEEYEFYLHKFRGEGGACFGLVVPSVEAVEESAEVLAFDLNFLHGLGLHVLTLLQGPRCDEMLERIEAAGHVCHVVEMSSGLGAVEALRGEVEALPEKGIRILLDRERGLDVLLPLLLDGFSRRVHFLRPEGGLRSVEGEKVMYYYVHRMSLDGLDVGDRGVAGLSSALLLKVPFVHVSITSSLQLLEEMFTVGGAGTLVRLGSGFVHLSEGDEVDLVRVQGLIEDSFGRRMRRPEVLGDVAEYILEEDYRGAALLERVPAGYYLSKFAVGTEARGEGLGQEIWGELDRYPALFWRSRSGNPFNAWYRQQSEGCHCTEKWHVFWRGIEVGDIADVIEYAVGRPSDF